MKQIDLKTRRIISKLNLIEALFDTASVKIQDKDIKDQLKKISEKKETFMNDIFQKLGMSIHSNKSFLENYQTSNQKMEELIIKMTQREIIGYCLRKEEELINMYQKALNVYKIEGKSRELLKHQLRESLTLFNQLKMAKESSHYHREFNA